MLLRLNLFFIWLVMIRFVTLPNWIECENPCTERLLVLQLHCYSIVPVVWIVQCVTIVCDAVAWRTAFFTNITDLTIKSRAFILSETSYEPKSVAFSVMMLLYWLLCFSGGKHSAISIKDYGRNKEQCLLHFVVFQVVLYPLGLLERDYSVCCLLFIHQNSVFIFICLLLFCCLYVVNKQ